MAGDRRLRRALAARARPLSTSIRRLRAADAAAFQALRLEGLRLHPLEFRIAPEDETATPDEIAARLERDFVVGAWRDDGLAGIGGLTVQAGLKLRHRALLWGMYVREPARGTGTADAIVAALLEEARRLGMLSVLLTVVAINARARRLYERHGFVVYGTEPGAVRAGDLLLDETLMVAMLAPPH